MSKGRKEFERCMEISRKYRWLLDMLYQGICFDRRYVIVDKSHFSTLVQKRMKTDVVGQMTQVASIGIEEKIAQWKRRIYTSFFLETDSCTNEGHKSPGWMRDGEADYLLYAFERLDIQVLHIYMIDFQRLKTWFWEHYQKYPISTMETFNRTSGRVVNIEDVELAVPCIDCFLPIDGIGMPDISEWWKGMIRQQQMFDEIDAALLL